MSKKIMFQGTGSTVGKSIITAALCRILNDEGYRVAPYKSQNMSLNSFVTKSGHEMGRAQVVQAEAARTEPLVQMNPILLKPTSDVGSQVILNGKVFKQLKAAQYYQNKPLLLGEALKAFHELEEMFDIIVIEGAGSPAEINLRKNDLVNMGLAEAIDTPVVLIGDIDKGGVFASIYGTYMLLSESEQKRIKGYIINKFRGDVALLMPGIEMFKEKVPIPCLGVIPFTDIQIDDEDSVTSRFDTKVLKAQEATEGKVMVGVVKLPYMSNFTDFTALELEADVVVNYLTPQSDWTNIDLLIIPGTKSTISDCNYLKQHHLTDKIAHLHTMQVPIIGICGGFQILGETIEDPSHMETKVDFTTGLGLLPCKTVMAPEKKTLQCTSIWQWDMANGAKTGDTTVEGYEIHMGVTTATQVNLEPNSEMNSNKTLDAFANEARTVFGTYMHGLFDQDDFRNAVLEPFRVQKGCVKTTSYEDQKEAAYDRLAEVVKSHIDMSQIWQILEEA